MAQEEKQTETEVGRFYTSARFFKQVFGSLPDGTKIPGGPVYLHPGRDHAGNHCRWMDSAGPVDHWQRFRRHCFAPGCCRWGWLSHRPTTFIAAQSAQACAAARSLSDTSWARRALER